VWTPSRRRVNKHTGYVLIAAVKELVATADENHVMTIRVAEGKSSVEGLRRGSIRT